MIVNQIATGASSSGLDTNDATAYPQHIRLGYTAYARGSKITGTYVSLANGFVFMYSGAVETITLPPGRYSFSVFGAKGGYRTDPNMGGPGGYAYGELTLTEDTLLYVYVGGEGNNGGFNGGGIRQGTYSTKMGGGASDIRVGTDSLYARLIVAGGGGSDGGSRPGKAGGGLEGISATENYGSGGQAGTQTAGGAGSGILTPGTFGQGGTGISSGGGNAGAGGGGWFGGAGSRPDGSGDDDRGGGGGSGYVLTATSFKPTGYLLGSTYYLENTILTTNAYNIGNGAVIIQEL